MKRFTVIVLFLGLLLSAFSCSESPAPANRRRSTMVSQSCCWTAGSRTARQEARCRRKRTYRPENARAPDDQPHRLIRRHLPPRRAAPSAGIAHLGVGAGSGIDRSFGGGRRHQECSDHGARLAHHAPQADRRGERGGQAELHQHNPPEGAAESGRCSVGRDGEKEHDGHHQSRLPGHRDHPFPPQPGHLRAFPFDAAS